MRRIIILLLLALGCLGGPSEAEIANWPHGHKSAACITFDTELATGPQIEKVVNSLGKTNATFFVVAAYFNERPEDLEPLRDFEVASMAWKQGKWEYNDRTPEFQLEEMQIADAWLKKRDFHPSGFRAPLLLSNADTIKAVNKMGYTYDSSQYPGTMPHMMHGVVEIPISLNFDTYWSEKSKEISEIPLYLAFEDVHKKDGLFTFYSHVGKTSENIDDFIDFLDYAEGRQVWLASAGQVADWWIKRDSLRLRTQGDLITVKNIGDEPIEGATVKISPKRGAVEGTIYTWEDEDTTYAVLPVINAGEEVSIL
jgi:peptidoglycan/xylan/chitin deacetylase (PgdA/CDA1 family)